MRTVVRNVEGAIFLRNPVNDAGAHRIIANSHDEALSRFLTARGSTGSMEAKLQMILNATSCTGM